MTDEYMLTIHPFEMGMDKEAALKPLEEASEAHGAWQMLLGAEMTEGKDSVWYRVWLTSLADELADTIQAACNLAARYDIDLNAAMERCERRNRERGRYGSQLPEMTEGARTILDRMMEGANDE
jgi:uncharacterized protein YabN with tetrapyrrole methylase and pyrophosphatase domain